VLRADTRRLAAGLSRVMQAEHPAEVAASVFAGGPAH
jgi:hypothetical protein